MAQWAIIVVALAAAHMLEDTLPAELQQHLRQTSSGGLTASDLVLLVVGTPAVVVGLVASVGLLCLQQWARWLYLCATVLLSVLTAVSGPEVSHGLTAALNETAVTLQGFVLALAFFSPALKNTGTMNTTPEGSHRPVDGSPNPSM